MGASRPQMPTAGDNSFTDMHKSSSFKTRDSSQPMLATKKGLNMRTALQRDKYESLYQASKVNEYTHNTTTPNRAQQKYTFYSQSGDESDGKPNPKHSSKIFSGKSHPN